MTSNFGSQWVRSGLAAALDSIIAMEAELGRLDAAAGDGDHGAAVVRGLRAAVAAVESLGQGTPAAGLLDAAGSAYGDAAGGASGALYGLCLSTVGQSLDRESCAPEQVARALRAGCDAVCRFGRTKPGDKTLVDALDPFITQLDAALAAGDALPAAWQAALAAAEEGAQATAQMVAKRGRSSRLGERSLGHPDPGAVSTLAILQAFGAALDQLERETPNT